MLAWHADAVTGHRVKRVTSDSQPGAGGERSVSHILDAENLLHIHAVHFCRLLYILRLARFDNFPITNLGLLLLLLNLYIKRCILPPSLNKCIFSLKIYPQKSVLLAFQCIFK
jgi:hypothetical protein